jgi:hypothetical protein
MERVVTEAQDPIPCRPALQELSPGRESGRRVEVKAHGRLQTGVGRGRDRIAGSHEHAVGADDLDALMMSRMPRERNDFDARRDLAAALDKVQDARRVERPKAERAIAGLVGACRTQSGLPLPFLDDVAGPREGRDETARVNADRVPAAMVKMKMSVDDEVDVPGPVTRLRQPGDQAFLPSKRIRPRAPGVEGFPDSGIDEENGLRQPDEKTLQRQGDPSPGIRGMGL